MFLDRCGQLNEALDQPALTTDIIVGFPGETEADFQQTCDVARQAAFSKIHTFPFSPRKGTPAADMADMVTKKEKAARTAELQKIEADSRANYHRSLIGKPLRVLAESSADDRPDIAMGTLDISLYRADLEKLGKIPKALTSDIPFHLDGAHVILFDDVLFTGRTIRAAINSLMDYGRPAGIELAALIDRGCRELPIQADYVGHHHDTTKGDYVRVRLKEFDDEEGIWLLK